MLDTDGTKEERIVEIKRLFGKENPTFDEMRAYVRKTNQETLNTFDGLINSRWIWGKNKTNLKIFRTLLKINADNEIDSLDKWEYIGKLDNAVRLLSVEIGKMKGISKKDFDNLQAKMDTLLESPAVKALSKILHDKEKELEKINKRREKLIRDSVV